MGCDRANEVLLRVPGLGSSASLGCTAVGSLAVVALLLVLEGPPPVSSLDIATAIVTSGS